MVTHRGASSTKSERLLAKIDRSGEAPAVGKPRYNGQSGRRTSHCPHRCRSVVASGPPGDLSSRVAGVIMAGGCARRRARSLRRVHVSDRFHPSTYEVPASDALIAFMRDGWHDGED